MDAYTNMYKIVHIHDYYSRNIYIEYIRFIIENNDNKKLKHIFKSSNYELEHNKKCSLIVKIFDKCFHTSVLS